MPEKKEVDTTTSVIQDLVQWDMGKLDSSFGKSNAKINTVKPKAIPYTSRISQKMLYSRPQLKNPR